MGSECFCLFLRDEFLAEHGMTSWLPMYTCIHVTPTDIPNAVLNVLKATNFKKMVNNSYQKGMLQIF